MRDGLVAVDAGAESAVSVRADSYAVGVLGGAVVADGTAVRELIVSVQEYLDGQDAPAHQLEASEDRSSEVQTPLTL